MAQELKTFDVGLGRYSEDGSPCIVAFDAGQNPQLLNGQIYLKDEVDAVLAEKDAEIRRLKRALYKACANWAKSERYTEATWHGDDHREELWANVQAKCRAMADKFKG